MESKENIKRARNFNDFDKNVLFEIVQNYLHIVENKKTDASNVKLKNEAWASIPRQFNSTSQSGIRTEKQLHALYDGIKKKARKNMYHDKKENYKTGGGLFTPKSDNLDSKIVQTLGVQFHSLPNSFDSSADYLNEDFGSEGRINVETCQQDCIQFNKSVETTQMDIEIESQMGTVKPIEVNTGEEEQTVKVIAVEVLEPSSMLQTPMKKRKVLASAGKLSEKKQSYLSTLSKRIVDRKNSKDYNDEKIRNKKLEILNKEESIKNKELEIKNMELQHMRRKYEIEMQHMQAKQKLELEIMGTELNIKKADLKEKELQNTL